MCNGAQAGVVSFGLECALADTPAVYVDVATYIPWLNNVTGLELSAANYFGRAAVTLLFICTIAALVLN